MRQGAGERGTRSGGALRLRGGAGRDKNPADGETTKDTKSTKNQADEESRKDAISDPRACLGGERVFSYLRRAHTTPIHLCCICGPINEALVEEVLSQAGNLRHD